MSRFTEPEKIFLDIGFRSPEPTGTLKTIELIGIPGEKLENGRYIVSDKVRHFFDDLMVRKIFSQSRRLPDCNFRHLKIWLYDTETKNDEREYTVPQLDERDLEIRSNIDSSKLSRIYILDNNLVDREYELWQRTAKDLFIPLFTKFLAPPEMPSELTENPFIKLMQDSPFGKVLESITSNLDPYGKMKQKLFFNALIVQID